MLGEGYYRSCEAASRILPLGTVAPSVPPQSHSRGDSPGYSLWLPVPEELPRRSFVHSSSQLLL